MKTPLGAVGPIGRFEDLGAWIVHRQIALAKHDSGGNACFGWHAWQNGPSGGTIAPCNIAIAHEQYTLAAIDDIIARGKRRDWAELRQAALVDRSLFEKVLRVCQAHVADPYAQRYHFWKQYAERYFA